MQRETISFEIINPTHALLEQSNTILNSFTQIENITFSNEKIVLKDFKNSMREVNSLAIVEKELNDNNKKY